MDLKVKLKQSLQARPLLVNTGQYYGIKDGDEPLYYDSTHGQYMPLYFALRSRCLEILDAEIKEAVRSTAREFVK